jgi:8-oxo-dGTP diphosphatase
VRYVVGFLYNPKRGTVALIEKQKPEWQKGFLNGVGGKIEEGETPAEAMKREFLEETGGQVDSWREFAYMNHSGNEVHFFVAKSESITIRSLTIEKVGWYNVDDIMAWEHNIIPNLFWLIPLALDKDEVFVKIEDKSTPWSK